MDELINATINWMNSPGEVDFNNFLKAFYAANPPAPHLDLDDEIEIEFDDEDPNMTDAEFWHFINA